MSDGRGPAAAISFRFKIVLLVAGPLLVAAFFGLGFPDRLIGPSGQIDPGERVSDLATAFEMLLLEAAEIPRTALESSAREAFANRGFSAIADRLEGVGILDRELYFLEWEGTPVEPDPMFGGSDSPPWSIRLDGVASRLVVRAGPDDDGRLALASFLIDARLRPFEFVELLPAELTAGIHLEVEFTDDEAYVPATLAGRGAPRGSETMLMLRSPAGDLLATAAVQPIQWEHSRSRLASAGRAWAVLLLIALLVLLFDWRGSCDSTRGFLTAATVLLAARAALLLTRAPALLLSREIGSASLFGSSEAAGLLASPADLMLTAATLYLLALAARRHGSPAFCLGAATLLVYSVIRITLSVAHNSTVPLLDRPNITGWNARSVIVVGLALAMLGAAELLAMLWTRLRTRVESASKPPSRIAVALITILIAVACAVTLQRLNGRLALERLEAEFAPQVLEQSSRRSLALSSAVRRVDQSLREHGTAGKPRSFMRDFLAYHFWVNSELFHSGYKASLGFYTPNGDLVSHFGLDLPVLEEEILPSQEESPELTIRNEDFTPAPAVLQALMHAEITVVRDGAVLGVVVGHILDEPENLPFLPWSQPYLAALGPGSPYRQDDPFSSGPDYVLYDEYGTVALSTLRQPPAATTELLRTAADRKGLRIRAGDESYQGLALRDGDRMHLLLLQAPGLIERLAAAVRLALIGLLILGLLALIPQLVPPHGPVALLRKLAGSFHRKLLAALLLASIVPLVGLSLFLRGYLENRGDAELVSSATQYLGAAQRLVEDFTAEASTELDDNAMYWLRRLLGQEIHVYENGLLRATSKPELFASGLLPTRVDGAVQRRLLGEGVPSFINWTTIGPSTIPVAYAPVRGADPARELLVAVPIILEQQQIARDVNRVTEMLLLATVLLVGLLSVAATHLARTVARPVRDLVGATARIADGDYAARLVPRTQDEVAELVDGFNSMASALAAQRSDLERRRDYMERLLQHATTGVISTDPDGLIVTFNPAAKELLAAAGEKLRTGADLVETLSESEELQPLAELLGSGTVRRGEPTEVDFERDRVPHRFRLVRINLPDHAGGTLGSLVLLDDVTELMRSNQLAAWAEMARAIAHEIKNPLTPIQLSTEHLQRLLRDRGDLPAPDMEACLETIIKQVRMLYQIAGEFSAYAKLPSLAPEPTDPVAFMRTTIGPYRAAKPPEIELLERYEPTGQVAIDAKVLSRAVLNLVENALQAMPDGGTLELSVLPDEAAGEAVLAVRDTGSGLDPDVKKKLFEPYFSTKSSGTGLGLAIVLRSVEAHKGTVEVDSELGRGTTFRIRLPLHAS
jgi:signal transduction histidine kinase